MLSRKTGLLCWLLLISQFGVWAQTNSLFLGMGSQDQTMILSKERMPILGLAYQSFLDGKILVGAGVHYATARGESWMTEGITDVPSSFPKSKMEVFCAQVDLGYNFLNPESRSKLSLSSGVGAEWKTPYYLKTLWSNRSSYDSSVFESRTTDNIMYIPIELRYEYAISDYIGLGFQWGYRYALEDRKKILWETAYLDAMNGTSQKKFYADDSQFFQLNLHFYMGSSNYVSTENIRKSIKGKYEIWF